MGKAAKKKQNYRKNRFLRVFCRGAALILSFSPLADFSLPALNGAALAQSAAAEQNPFNAEVYGPALPRKRKFINSGVLKPKVKPLKKQEPDFPPFSDSVFVPKFFDSQEHFERVDLSGVSRLRFLTTSDFFPFNYEDANGDLAGYNVDLARALCAELRLENVCFIEAAPWESLPARLAQGDADALLAGLAPTGQNRRFLQFSRAYMRFPARFIGLAGSAIAADSSNFIRQGYDFSEFLLLRGASLKIGVLSGTEHEQMLKNYFAARSAAPLPAKPLAPPPDTQKLSELRAYYQSAYRGGRAEDYTAKGKNALQIMPYADNMAVLAALKRQEIDLAFGDGMGFALLMEGQDGQAEKQQSDAPADAPPRLIFLGGAYPGVGYLGQGMRIAVRQNQAQLAHGLNYALQQLERKGKLAELYLRYFPVGFY